MTADQTDATAGAADSAPAQSLTVIHRDADLIAINKPAGLLVHRSSIDAHNPDNAVKLLRRQTGSYLYPVHRLDRPTSGALLFALNRSCAAGLATMFEKRQIRKVYLAVVRGFTDACGTIDYAVRDRDSEAKDRYEATTHYRTLRRMEIDKRVDRYPSSRYSLVELTPVTGRRHQLRMHMKHINHPIIGDTSYGKGTHNRFFRDYFNCERLLLHARQLQFLHPAQRVACNLTAAVEDCAFKRVLQDPNWVCVGTKEDAPG